MHGSRKWQGARDKYHGTVRLAACHLRLATVLAALLLIGAPLSARLPSANPSAWLPPLGGSTQSQNKIDPMEMAAVERIRARIEEQVKKTEGAASAYKVTIPNSTVTFTMAPVPAGEFVMGSADPGAKPDEQPPHTVKLDAFWMQAHEVTWDAYLMFMFADQAKEAARPDAMVDALSRPTAPHLEMSFGRGNSGFPAISMTQHAANKFAQWLSAKTGEYYRLPTEAEWEYACRAGAKTPPVLDDVAWYKKNSTTKA